MKTHAPNYHDYGFASEIINYPIWLSHQFYLNFRGVEEILPERGMIVTYETISQ